MGDLPFSEVFGQAAFAGNALLGVAGSTPYAAVYGRVPRILPDISCVPAPNESRMGVPGSIGYVHRLREASVGAMVQASARARLSASWRTHSTQDGRQMNLKVGGEVEYYRNGGILHTVLRKMANS